MAHALARVQRIENNGDGRFALILHVIFTAPEAGGVWDGEIPVYLNGDEAPTTLRSLMSAAVVAWPAANGHAWTIPGGNATLPTFQKG